jgi:hypothetical protein
MAKGIWLKAKAREGRANGRERVQIRQQLQELRDLGFLLHVERGVWRLP